MAPHKDKSVQEGSSYYPISSTKALLCCAYSLPVTPQMLLLATQRLADGKGADIKSIVRFVRKNFPVVVNQDEKLEDEIRRKLAICINAGVLVADPEPCLDCTHEKKGDACKTARFKPPRDIAYGRLQCSHLQRFYSSVIDQTDPSCTQVTTTPPTKKVGQMWHQRLGRRIIDTARTLAAKVADSLDAEEEHGTQTDNMVTDWVNPDIADADYII